ncbi:unnamed protein product [Danaus chrysippus]|uniref:(African queen) hypothetical protein n=1 Tax=Danaus chrysippus TaxID=151541 RepID=A0A8J2QME6_9NEOP|nr:unnamed protein product [Danaus chrysippus]
MYFKFGSGKQTRCTRREINCWSKQGQIECREDKHSAKINVRDERHGGRDAGCQLVDAMIHATHSTELDVNLECNDKENGLFVSATL